jgi:hypothetical protein
VNQVTDGDHDDALFVNLVLIFQGAAMQQMGKIISPMTGKIERNFEQARFSIDMLAMLQDKTKGNLSDDLARLLDSTVLNLRMNYVAEVEASGKAAEEMQAEGKPSGTAPAGDGSTQDKPPETASAAAAGEPAADKPPEAPTAQPAGAEPSKPGGKARRGPGRPGRRPGGKPKAGGV